MNYFIYEIIDKIGSFFCNICETVKNEIYWMNKAADSKKKNWIKNTGYCDERKKAREWCKKNNDILEIKEKAFLGDSKAMYDYVEHGVLSEQRKRSNGLLSDLSEYSDKLQSDG